MIMFIVYAMFLYRAQHNDFRPYIIICVTLLCLLCIYCVKPILNAEYAHIHLRIDNPHVRHDELNHIKLQNY